MGLTQRINEDLKAAMKSGNKLRLETLRMLRAQIIEFEKKGLDRPMNEDDEMSILMSATKKRKEAIEHFKNAGRMELVEQETKEMEIIAEYLPKQLSREEAERIIEEVIRQSGAGSMKDMGKVMPIAIKELKGKIDPKVISEIVKQKLEGVSIVTFDVILIVVLGLFMFAGWRSGFLKKLIALVCLAVLSSLLLNMRLRLGKWSLSPWAFLRRKQTFSFLIIVAES